jgi:hypothetical protein
MRLSSNRLAALAAACLPELINELPVSLHKKARKNAGFFVTR